ncbi:hypothetical protein [Pseudactinotalea sp. Z1732]|uniref:CpsD/CapB family tyrosine-protein kinase n=1 Tax=Micrococcales TaxID=85006 RepID=UPI003C7A87D4
MTLREFGRVIRAGWYLVLLAMVVALTGAWFYLDRQMPMFESVTRLELQEDLATELSEGTSAGAGSEGDVSASFRSSSVAEAAATLLDSSAPPTLLASMVSAEQFGPMVDVTAEGFSPEQAMEIADAFAQAYIDNLAGYRTAEIEYVEERQEALSEQLTDVTDRLNVNEDDALALAEQNLIVEEYTALSVRLNTLQATPELAVITSPAESAAPQGMPDVQVIALAGLGGLVAGVGLAFLRRSLDQRLRIDGEVAELAGAPVLAHIYGLRQATRDFRATRMLPVTRHVATPFTESIRELRTAVAVTMPSEQHQVVVVTAVDGHGSRSFGAANLAASFALSGRSTIALSGDLRQPDFDRLFQSVGASSESDPQRSEIANLSVRTLPLQRLDPADYLATDGVRAMIEELRSACEVLVIDAPPVLAAADATILGQYASGVVLVATAGKTERNALTEAVDRLRTNQVPLVGIALVGVARDRRILYASTYGSDELTGRGGKLRRLFSRRRRSEHPQAGTVGTTEAAVQVAGTERTTVKTAGADQVAAKAQAPGPGPAGSAPPAATATRPENPATPSSPPSAADVTVPSKGVSRREVQSGVGSPAGRS